MWMIMAVLSALFAGLTTILAKCGIKNTDSDLATAIRTVVVLLFSWLMVWVVGSAETIVQLETKSLVFLVLSGMATGLSWICYFKALSMADVNKVVPIDKSSTVLTVLLAILLFGENHNLLVKLVSTVLIGIGALLMIEKKDVVSKQNEKGWLLYASLAAIFAAMTSILAKIGIAGVESNLGTAIRTCVVLLLAWGIVLGKGKQHMLRSIDKKEMVYICLSGIATGASWLCYYYAIQNGIVSIVVPIDKMSILITVAFSYIFLKEKLNRKSFGGLMMMAAGTLSMALFG